MRGNKLKEIRLENNMTQAELAEKLSITQQAVARIENGNSRPSLGTAYKISVIFNKTIDEIFF